MLKLNPQLFNGGVPLSESRVCSKSLIQVQVSMFVIYRYIIYVYCIPHQNASRVLCSLYRLDCQIKAGEEKTESNKLTPLAT